MRCTSCSNEVRPVVVVDIDGTLGDYHAHFIDFAYQYLGEDPPMLHAASAWSERAYDGSLPFKDWFCDWAGVSVEMFRDIKLAYRQGGMKRTMPVYDNARLLVRRARNEGAEVWIATTRPFQRLDNIDPDTRWWLDRNDIVCDGMIYGDDKYEKLARLIDPPRVVAVVEDLMDKCEEAERVFNWESVIWKRSRWNRGQGAGGLELLSDVSESVTDKISKWKAANA